MSSPPPYPRVPSLGSTADDDIAVPAGEERRWLRAPVRVEEKLDGANVSVWMDDRRPRVAGRGGTGGMDRAGQLGPLRAWAAERAAQLGQLLGTELALYGEWLWLEHSMTYHALPDHLIVLDLWSPSRGFLDATERGARAGEAGLSTPPLLLEGVAGSRRALDELTRRSRWGRGHAEGAVLRRDHADGSFDRCKWIRDDFVRRSDAQWRTTRRNRRASSRT